MGWGTGSWGTSAWGIGATVSALTIESARPTSPRSVLITVSREPLAASSIGGGDATNPRTWTLTNLSTGATLTILSVARRSPTTYEAFTLQTFAAYPNQMRIQSTMLRTTSGVVITAPNSATFNGMALSTPAEPVRAQRDLENPAFDVQTHPGGTLYVGADGDYTNHSGIEFLRKLIYRRLVTTPGGFFHLPDYGLGIQLKEPLRVSDLNRLRAAIELQILQEPEFSRVRVRLSLQPNGVLTIVTRAILSTTNEEVSIPLEIPPSGVQL